MHLRGLISIQFGFKPKAVATANMRNSSIELLRIISMIMVLCLHCNKDILITNDFQMLAINRVLICFIEALSIVAVDVFVLITGYYSVANTRIKWRKIADLVFLTSGYGGGIFLLGCVLGAESFSVKEFLKCLFPYFFNRVWFVNCYIVLLVFSPFINKLLRDLTLRSFRLLLALMILFFSIWPTFLPNPLSNDGGYGIISFVLLYCIGFYLRQYYQMSKKSVVRYFITYVFATIPTLFWFYYYGGGLAYNSIFIIIGSVSLVCCFLVYNWHSRIVNSISKSVIAVLIIHTHHTIRPDLFIQVLKTVEHLDEMTFVLSYTIDICIVFIICILIDYARRIVFAKSINRIFDKNKMINSVFEIE